LQAALPSTDLLPPFIAARNFKQAAELCQDYPKLLHELIMRSLVVDGKKAFAIVLDCGIDPAEYQFVEIAAKLPEMEIIMHQGLLVYLIGNIN
jgi:hypothetical protein